MVTGKSRGADSRGAQAEGDRSSSLKGAFRHWRSRIFATLWIIYTSYYLGQVNFPFLLGPFAWVCRFAVPPGAWVLSFVVMALIGFTTYGVQVVLATTVLMDYGTRKAARSATGLAI